MDEFIENIAIVSLCPLCTANEKKKHQPCASCCFLILLLDVEGKMHPVSTPVNPKGICLPETADPVVSVLCLCYDVVFSTGVFFSIFDPTVIFVPKPPSVYLRALDSLLAEHLYHNLAKSILEMP